MRIRSTFACALTTALILSSLPASANEALCLEAVKEQRFERLTTVCVDLPHRNRLEKMRLLMSGNFTHYLGTVENPSEAFVLLREIAETDDSDAQYMYSQLYETVHPASEEGWARHPGNNGRISREDYNSRVNAEATRWLQRAAENGHTLALLETAEAMLLKSYTSEEIDLREALAIAERANESNPALASSLITRLKKRISEY